MLQLRPLRFRVSSFSRGFCSLETSGGHIDLEQRQQLYVKTLEHGVLQNIRNFCIVAHIDHGKSSLSDRLIEQTQSMSKIKLLPQVLDSLEVERSRGITIKAQTAAMLYKRGKESYLLNLIDTPGHVDFAYEVSRSVQACEAALLLVDASQGIQAQTLANYKLVQDANLFVIPVLTKIDLPHADPDKVKEQLLTVLDIDPDDVLLTSAKTGQGVSEILEAIVMRASPPVVPSTLPNSDIPFQSGDFMMQILDSWFDRHRGVVCLVKVVRGVVRPGDLIKSISGTLVYEIQDVGVLSPDKIPVPLLSEGHVGYLMAGIKSIKDVALGDTLYKSSMTMTTANALVPFKRNASMVYAGIYPLIDEGVDQLRSAIDKLLLNDASVEMVLENSEALGTGFRCGFNGVLHMEVFCERLVAEFGIQVMITAPTVPYRVFLKNDPEKFVTVSSAKDFPSQEFVAKVQEPMMIASIVCPDMYIGVINEIAADHRGIHDDLEYISETQVLIKFKVPLSEIVSTFYTRVKSETSGHASVDFVDAGFQDSELVKVDVLVNGDKIDALSSICEKSKAPETGRRIASKLRSEITRQNFEIIIQAAIGSKFVARERLAPYRKDVLTKSGKTVGGGDESRKKKLIEQQKEGKKKLKQVGSVHLSQEAFFSILKL